MIGLIILLTGIVYLVLLVWITRISYRWAKGKGFSKWKCVFAGAGGFLVVYLPIFWEHIPTLVAYEYYCKRDAGLWTYKTIEQWKKENPGVAATLVHSADTHSQSDGITRTYDLNQRFINRTAYKSIPLIPITVFTNSIVDKKTGEDLVKHVSVGAGYGNMMIGNDWHSMKFWLNLGPCEGESLPLRGKYEALRRAFERIGEPK